MDRLARAPQVVELCLAALVTVALAAYLTPTASQRFSARCGAWLVDQRRLVIVVLLAVAFTACIAIGFGVLDRFQNSGDEFAYFFQAELFAKGKLWASAPPLGDTFVPYRTWIIDGKWLSQYPPGWPLALGLGLATGIPAWSVNAVLGAGGAAALLSPLWRVRIEARLIAAAAYVATPFFLLNAASYHSHMLSALLILSFCLCCLKYERDGRPGMVILAGLLLGLIGFTRYYSLILLFPAIAHWLLIGRRPALGRLLRVAGLLVLGGLPFLALLMAYQYEVTGSALRSTYALITEQDTFVTLSAAALVEGSKLTVYRFEELDLWASPLLLPLYLFFIVSKIKRRSIAFYDWVFPTFILGYVFFTELGGNRYGPRYYMDAFPLMLVTLMSAMPQAEEWARRICKRPIAVHAILVSAVYLLIATPLALVAFHRQVETRREPYRLAAAEKLDHAVVIIGNTSGHGLMAEDLARNHDGLRDPVLYARPGVTADEVRRTFPGRSVWLYVRENLNKPGTLQPAP